MGEIIFKPEFEHGSEKIKKTGEEAPKVLESEKYSKSTSVTEQQKPNDERIKIPDIPVSAEIIKKAIDEAAKAIDRKSGQ